MAMPRFVKWLLWGMATVVVLAALWIAGLFVMLAPSEDEVARVSSPGGNTDAVLVETNGGATTSFGYEVHVVPRGSAASGRRVAFVYGAVRNHGAYGANLVWDSPNILAVQFLQARSAAVERNTVVVAEQSVHIVLREGVRDPSAPAGGMLYNLHGRP